MADDYPIKEGDVFTNDHAEWKVIDLRDGSQGKMAKVEDMTGSTRFVTPREIVEKFAF